MSEGATSTRSQRWTEKQFRAAVANSESIAQVIRALGLAPAGGSYGTVSHWIAAWELDTSHFTGKAWVGTRPDRLLPGQKYTLKTIFCENSTYPTSRLLPILLREGLRERRCEGCGLTEWQGDPIPIETDHINGINTDHRIENLRLLCPNCHALTPTWRGRKNKKLQATPQPRERIVRTPDERAAHVKYVKRHREKWIAQNGPCQRCGGEENLAAAYIDPAAANMMASRIWQKSAAVRAVELAKCHVICGKCYLDAQAAERRGRGFRHGTRSMYKKHKCRCPECRAWKSADARRLRQNQAARGHAALAQLE